MISGVQLRKVVQVHPLAPASAGEGTLALTTIVAELRVTAGCKWILVHCGVLTRRPFFSTAHRPVDFPVVKLLLIFTKLSKIPMYYHIN